MGRGSEDGNNARTSADAVKSVTVNESVSEVQNQDKQNLLTKIKEVYQDIIRQSSNKVTISGMDSIKSTKYADSHKETTEGLKNIGKYEEALLESTKTIAFTEPYTQELAEAYTVRAEILRRLEKFTSCRKDLKRATKIRDCSSELINECKKVRRQLKSKIEKKDVLDWKELCTFQIPDTPNPKISKTPQISDKLMEEDMQMIATENIQPGEILFVDDFCCTRLDDSKRYTHCSFCLSKCDTLIPCFTCSLEMYCSEKCKKEASDSYHETECKLFEFNHGHGLDGSRLLGIRKFLIETEKGRNLSILMNGLNPRDIFEPKFDFITRFGNRNSRRAVDRIQEIMANVRPAVETIVLLLRSSFFSHSATLPDELGIVEKRATLSLINNFLTIRSEDFRIFIPNEDSFQKGTPKVPAQEIIPQVIGDGIWPSRGALVKPSCDGNTSFFTQKRRQIVFATRTIRHGEKLSIDFVKHPFTHWMSEEQYDCKWEMCSTDWPKKNSLKSETQFIISSPESLEAAIENLVKKTQYFVEVTTPLCNEEILQFVIDYCTLLCEIISMPSFFLLLCEHVLVFVMKIFFCDCHRQYNDSSLQDYVADKIKTITDDLENLYLEKFQIL